LIRVSHSFSEDCKETEGDFCKFSSILYLIALNLQNREDSSKYVLQSGKSKLLKRSLKNAPKRKKKLRSVVEVILLPTPLMMASHQW